MRRRMTEVYNKYEKTVVLKEMINK
jgi:hypothetical protein